MDSLAKAERVAYLANVLAIAAHAGEIGPEEARVIEHVAARVAATDADMEAARHLQESGHYKMALMRDQRIRMANLEDMVLVALADGTIREAESAPIEKLAGAMRYSQVDIEMAVRRAKQRLRKLANQPSRPTAAPKTVATRRRPARTVSRPDPKSGPPPPLPVPPNAEEAIDQPESESEAEPDAKMAEKQHARESLPAEPEADSVSQDEEALILAACIEARNAAANPDAHCFGVGDASLNIWGCCMARMPWAAGQNWLSLGTFRSDNVFEFDRDAIRREVVQALRPVASCPCLQAETVGKAIDCMPSRARVGPRWVRRPAKPDGTGVVLNVRERVHGCEVCSRRRVEGLDPVGVGEARRIVRDVCRAVNRPPLAFP